MQTYETIYKRTSTGKVQIWCAEVDGGRYRTVSGQQDGKKTTSEWTITQPKNIGRANATTAEEQAVAEVEAMYEKKTAREYRYDLNEIDNKHYTKPMKSLKWKDIKSRPSEGTLIAVQPKLDGMRCLTSTNGPKSQDGKIIPGAPHIMQALLESGIFNDPEATRLELDGELYNHDYAEGFEQLMSAMKKEADTPELKQRARDVVQYHLYDLPSMAHIAYAVLDDGYNVVGGRLFELRRLHEKYLAQFGDMFKLTETIFVRMDSDGGVVDRITEGFLNQKYEGSMVRIINLPYENKTSKSLIKVKPMEDAEFPFIRAEEGKGNWAGVAKVVYVRLEDGREQKATPKGDKDYCRRLLENQAKYVGAPTTVTFLRRTADGALYLPIMKQIRWDVPGGIVT